MQVIAFNGVATAIDSSGDIVGAYQQSSQHAFLWTNGMTQYNPQDLGTLGGATSTAFGIDVYGEVVGGADTISGHHAFFYDTSMQDLGTLSGGTSDAYGINDNAHVVGTSDSHAFIVSNGSMQDLNSNVVNGAGWTLQSAQAINDSEQIVGVGVTNGHMHAFMLQPVPLGWHETMTATKSQPIYAGLPTKGPGKDSLILITHGWIKDGTTPESSTGWVDAMSNAVQTYINNHPSLNNWQVIGYKWIDGADIPLVEGGPQTALENALQIGQGILANYITNQGYSHVHLIAHSAGAGLIQAATDVIKTTGSSSSSIVIHETFLDPFVGTKLSGIDEYGNGANWADNYSTQDSETGGDILPFTYDVLKYSYNINVTQLDVNDRKANPYWVTGSGIPCYITESVHSWPVDFYLNTITGAVSSDYNGFGFPLSEVGGQWSYALSNYTVGNGATYGSATNLGTPDPTGCRFQFPAPIYPSRTMDFISNPSATSTTGTIEKYLNGSVKKKSGSPAWLATFIMVTNPVNVVSFDAEFQDAPGSQGLETVYWDTNSIGSIDERVVQSGFQHYTFKFSSALDNNVHMLGFRLDPFTNVQSIIVITNVALTYSGVSQPFTLAVTGSTNGLLTYQLSGQQGFEYNVQASTDLLNWSTIAVLANTNGTVQFYDQDSTNYNQRFYRAVAPY